MHNEFDFLEKSPFLEAGDKEWNKPLTWAVEDSVGPQNISRRNANGVMGQCDAKCVPLQLPSSLGMPCNYSSCDNMGTFQQIHLLTNQDTCLIVKRG